MTASVDRGRRLFAQQAWAHAFAELTAADGESSLATADLERVAISAYLVGRLPESIGTWERVYLACQDAGDTRRAARSAFWLAFVLLNDGELVRGGGWVHRAQRLLATAGTVCVEQGYLAYCAALRCVLDGDLSGAASGFAAAAQVGERFGNQELLTLAQVGQGRRLLRSGDIAGGMALLDEAMASVTLDEISPTAVGDLYCTVIEGCQEVFDVRRAQEWTDALNRWCATQPELVLYRGQCLVHRAELMLLSGLWPEALLEVDRASDRLSRPRSQAALGAAYYVRAELHRLRGQWGEAEAAYRQASTWGREPQPGLAQLRLAQGRTVEARAALRRALAEAGADRMAAARLLGPYVEAALVLGDVGAAREAAADLAGIAAAFGSAYVDAVAAHAVGAVLLAEGDAGPALAPLRQARATWVDLGAPYEAARSRVLVAQACLALGDEEGAGLELDAARSELRRLGAPVEVVHEPAPPHGMTPRELEVLQRLATGMTNRAIAAALFITEKTVATHVSSILRKLDVESRAAATAYAHRHRLL